MNKKYAVVFSFFLTLSVFADEWVDGFCNDGQGYMEFTFGEYFGECKDERTEHGNGAFTFADTSIYFDWMEDGTVYEGDWVNANMQGTGKLTWPDGTTYEGSFFEQKRQGLGYETKSNGKGNFVMYENNNLSTKTYLCVPCSSKEVNQFWLEEGIRSQYSGKGSNGKRNGKGTYTRFFDNYQTRNTYEGDFVDGNINGKGKFNYTNVATYEGDFVDGKRSGSGIWTALEEYNGMWKDDKKYNGMWKDDKRHGFGITTKLDGTSFAELYNMNKLLDVDGFCMEGNCENGRGRYVNSNGELYEGKFAGGKRNGAGTLINLLDNTSNKSIWENEVALCDFSQAKVIDKKLVCGDAKTSSSSNNGKEIASGKNKTITSKKINAIVFKDLHWEMSEYEIKEVLNKQSDGLCSDLDGVGMSCFVGNMNADNMILLNSAYSTIYFGCETYNGCNYDSKEMSKIIGDDLGLEDWKFQLELDGAFGQFYCAQGAAGDKICTSKIIANNNSRGLGVYLVKGGLGSSGADF